jgi:hypothetical protein
MKLIDADKLIGLLGYLIEATDSKLEKNLLWSILEEIESGKCDPTPPVQPDTKPGDKVYHQKFKASGIVDKISKSGLRAKVRWHDGTMSSYVDIKSLEVIPNDPST